MATQHKALTWTGWVLTAFIGLGLSASAIIKFVNPPAVSQEFVDRLGYPANANLAIGSVELHVNVTLAIGIVELTCVLIYLFPRTAVLGAVLLTGYLGGAIATHVRVLDPFYGPAIGGVIVWLALFLRDRRVRALLPIRWSAPPNGPS